MIKISEYFPKPNSVGIRVKVDLDLFVYATKTDLQNAAGVDASSFAKQTDLANLKSDVDILDIGKLKNLPTNFRNLKSKVDKLDVDTSVLIPVDSSEVVNHLMY